MANQLSQKPVGIAKDMLVMIQDQYVPTDFTILDMGQNREVPLLLGRLFLNTTHAELHVGMGFARFYIQGRILPAHSPGIICINKIKASNPRNMQTTLLNRYGR
jgi:hypothetical protein